jgi:hypothetical protein
MTVDEGLLAGCFDSDITALYLAVKHTDTL